MKGVVLTASLFLFCAHVRNVPRASAYASPARGQDGGAGAEPSPAKAIFEERCARCHGRDGRGQTTMGELLEPPDFTDAGWQESVSDQRMRDSITDGVNAMPAFGSKLSRREVSSLVAYVRGFARARR